MKKLISLLAATVLGVILAVGTLGTTGCTTTTTTTGTNTTSTTSLDLNKVDSGLNLLTRAGTKFALLKVPDTRPYFTASVAVLDTLVLQAQNGQEPDLAAALAKLPVGDLASPEGQLAISTIQDLYDTTLADVVKGGVAKSQAAVGILTALRDGVSNALAAVPATASFKVHFNK